MAMAMHDRRRWRLGIAMSVGAGWRAAALAALVALPLAASAADARSTLDGAADVVVAGTDPVVVFPDGISFPAEVSSDEEIAEISLLYRPEMIETLNEAPPDFEPGMAASVVHDLDLRDGSLPTGIDIVYHWRITEADGDVVETPERSVTWYDSRFTWETIESELVSVNYYDGNVGHAQAVLESADATVRKLAERFGAELTDPIRLWIYPSREDFNGSLAPNSEPWMVGAAYPWFGVIKAVLPPGDSGEIGRVVPHEISHQVLYQATKNPFNSAPAWLDEGLASLEQENGQDALWAAIVAAGEAGQLGHIRVLNGQFPYDTGEAMLAYAQSLSIVTYIIDTYGEEGLSKLIAVFREGVTYDEAVERALGVTMDELDAAWRAAAPEQARRQLNPVGGDNYAGIDLGGDDAALLASGGLVMAVVAVAAVVLGIRARRNVRQWEDEADPTPGLTLILPDGGHRHILREADGARP